MCDLKDMKLFAEKLSKLSLDGSKRFGADYHYDVDAEVWKEEFEPIVAIVWKSNMPILQHAKHLEQQMMIPILSQVPVTLPQVAKYTDIAPTVKPLVADTVEYINDAYDSGKRILIEGANATMLDLDFGTYPYVTSSNPSIGGIATGLGLAPNKYSALIGVVSLEKGR